MADSSGEERSLPPSDFKLNRLRDREKQVARTQEGLSTAILIAIIMYIIVFVQYIFMNINNVFYNHPFSADSKFSDRVFDILSIVRNSSFNILLPMLVIMLVTALFTMVIDARGFIVTTKAIAPKFEKLNPVSNLKNIFGIQALLALAKDTVRIVFLLLGSTLIITMMLGSLLWAPTCGPTCALHVNSIILLSIVAFGASITILAAIVDVPVSRFLFKRNNRTTVSESKREVREQHGHPMTRSARSAARRAARTGPVVGIRRSTFVVFSSDIAVGLRFVPAEIDIPIVMAKSRSAEEISRFDAYCVTHGLPRIFDDQLARKLEGAVIGSYPPVGSFSELAVYLVALKLKVLDNAKPP